MSFFTESKRYVVEFRDEYGKLEAVRNYDTLQQLNDDLKKYPLTEGHTYEVIDRFNNR